MLRRTAQVRASPLARAAPLVRGARGRRSRARAQRFGFGRGDGDDEVDRLRETLSDWRDEREGATGGAARAAARAQRAAEALQAARARRALEDSGSSVSNEGDSSFARRVSSSLLADQLLDDSVLAPPEVPVPAQQPVELNGAVPGGVTNVAASATERQLSEQSFEARQALGERRGSAGRKVMAATAKGMGVPRGATVRIHEATRAGAGMSGGGSASGSGRLAAIGGAAVCAVFAGWAYSSAQRDPGRPLRGAPAPAAAAPTEGSVQSIMGHRRQVEAKSHQLTPVTGDGLERMRHAAADDFLRMQADARWEGVYLVPLSTFRSVAEQQRLFFETKAERNQGAGERARVSAPPGFSEHHTGYAVDIGDGEAPHTHLIADPFERTRAYDWLRRHAARYHFELSFPRNNAGGVDYEPWHWRWVGDTEAMMTFYGSTN